MLEIEKRNCQINGNCVFTYGDPVGILTRDLQNRNLTFYTAELRSHFCGCKGSKLFQILKEWWNSNIANNKKIGNNFLFPISIFF